MKQGKHVDGDLIKTYRDDKLHSYNDEPAVTYEDGSKFWYQDGKRHRDNDLPAVVFSDGSKMWYFNDERHRLLGCAVIWANETAHYYIDGQMVGHHTWKNHPLVKKAKLQKILDDAV
jgi:hypothetical protein